MLLKSQKTGMTRVSSCHHGFTMPTSLPQWLRQTQASEGRRERRQEKQSRFKGGGAQTEEEWVRQADIHLHTGPSNKRRIMGEDCVRLRQTLWVSVLEVNPCEDECVISLTGDSGCEAEVTATLLTSFNMCMWVPLRSAHKEKVEGEWVTALRTHSEISPDGNLIKGKWNIWVRSSCKVIKTKMFKVWTHFLFHDLKASGIVILKKKNPIDNYCFKKYSFHFPSAKVHPSLPPTQLVMQNNKKFRKRRKIRTEFWHRKTSCLKKVEQMDRWKTSAGFLYMYIFCCYYNCPACSFLAHSLHKLFWDLFKKLNTLHSGKKIWWGTTLPFSFLPPTTATFSSQAAQLFVWAHTNTLLFIMLIWHCRSWEGETAVLVWPWAHPSLVPASLHSIPPPPSPPWYHVSLPLCLQHC